MCVGGEDNRLPVLVPFATHIHAYPRKPPGTVRPGGTRIRRALPRDHWRKRYRPPKADRGAAVRRYDVPRSSHVVGRPAYPVPDAYDIGRLSSAT